MIFKDELADNLLHARLDAGLTQRELGSMVGVGANAISQYENALRMPDLHRFALMACALSVSPTELLPTPTEVGELGDMIPNMTIYDILEGDGNENGNDKGTA